MLHLSAERHRLIVWWEDALSKTFWETIWRTCYSIRFIGSVSPYNCERSVTHPSIWKESFTWTVLRICFVRGWIWKGDVLIADFEEWETMDAAEINTKDSMRKSWYFTEHLERSVHEHWHVSAQFSCLLVRFVSSWVAPFSSRVLRTSSHPCMKCAVLFRPWVIHSLQLPHFAIHLQPLALFIFRFIHYFEGRNSSPSKGSSRTLSTMTPHSRTCEKACLSVSRRRPRPSERCDPMESEQGDLLHQVVRS